MYLYITSYFDDYHVYGQIDENTLEGPYDLNHEVLYKLLSFMKPVQMRSMLLEKMYNSIQAFYIKSIIYYYFFRYECIASISNELFTSIQKIPKNINLDKTKCEEPIFNNEGDSIILFHESLTDIERKERSLAQEKSNGETQEESESSIYLDLHYELKTPT